MMTEMPNGEDRIAEILRSLRANMAALDELGLQVASAHLSMVIELIESKQA